MACHVSTCMAHGEGFILGCGAIRTGREQQKGKEGKKKEEEGKKGKKKRGKEKRERSERRRKGKRCSDDRNSLDQEVKSVYSMTTVLQEVGFLILRFISCLGAM